MFPLPAAIVFVPSVFESSLLASFISFRIVVTQFLFLCSLSLILQAVRGIHLRGAVDPDISPLGKIVV